MFRPVVAVPLFDHLAQFRGIAPALRACGVPVLVVDDGSADAAAVAEFCRGEGFSLLRHAKNRGKGAAVKTALAWAAENGFSHALQIDADGQHDVSDVPRFLDAARAAPDALVNGVPVYDASAPRSRTRGRKITDFWVALETRSRAVGDAMCGFRVYPLSPAMLGVLPRLRFDGMGADIEIIVRAVWAGVPVRNLPTRVRYPENGVSHFRMFSDNVKISALHARLFLGSLFRIPPKKARAKENAAGDK